MEITSLQISKFLDGLKDSDTKMDDLKHLDPVDFHLLEFGIIGGMTSLRDRDFPPLFVGWDWDSLILKSLELFVGSL